MEKGKREEGRGKREKKNVLTNPFSAIDKEQKKENKELAKKRIIIEHINRIKKNGGFYIADIETEERDWD